MRRGFPIFLAIVGVLCLAVGVPGLWVQNNIVSPQGFVQLNKSVEQDPEFEKTLAESAIDTLAAKADVPAALKSTVASAASDVVESLQHNPGYPEAFAKTIESSHAALFPPKDSGQEPRVALDIAPMLNLIAKQAAGSLDSIDIGGVHPDISADSLMQNQPVYRALSNQNPSVLVNAVRAYGAVGLPLSVVGGVLIVLAVVIARRRGTVMVVTGVGGLLFSLLHWLLTPVVLGVLKNFKTSNDMANAYISALLPAVSASVNSWVVVEAIVSAAILVLGVVVNLLFRAGTRR